MTGYNNIPDGWQVKKLGEVCKCITGTTPPKNDLDNYGIDIPFVKPPQVFDKPINDAPEKLSKKGADIARILPINSVLVTCIGNLGRTAINRIPVAFNQQINALVPPENIDGRFLFYQAQSPDFRHQLEDLSAATTVAIVNKGKFETIRIKIPPLPEQLTIVSKIEELLSDLENGKQQLQTAQQQLKFYRQSLLKWAFEGKLTHKNVIDGELPKGWKMVTVKDVCLKIVGGGTPSTKIDRYWIGDIPWISSADIYGINEIKPRRKITKEAIKNSATNLLPSGGIIVVTRVGLGKLAVAPFDICFSQDSQGLVLNEKYLTTKFALWILHQQVQIFKYQSRGTTINGVTKKQLADLEIPLPPLKEQQIIVDELESKLTVCDKIEEVINQSLLHSETLRQSILNKAFEGKLV